jgi:hypothetical protein
MRTNTSYMPMIVPGAESQGTTKGGTGFTRSGPDYHLRLNPCSLKFLLGSIVGWGRT